MVHLSAIRIEARQQLSVAGEGASLLLHRGTLFLRQLSPVDRRAVPWPLLLLRPQSLQSRIFLVSLGVRQNLHHSRAVDGRVQVVLILGTLHELGVVAVLEQVLQPN